MASSTKFANANAAVVAGGWTSPTGAYSDDGAYATAAPAKNGTISSDYGFPAFTSGDIPDGAGINSVTVEVQWKVSTTGSIDTLGVQLHNPAGTALGSETTTTTATTADSVSTQQVTSGIPLADLRSANVVVARVRASRGNTNTAFTASLDYVKVTVDYTPANNVTGALAVSGGSALAATVASTNRSTCALAVSGGSSLAGVLEQSEPEPPNDVTGALVVSGGASLSAVAVSTIRVTAALATSGASLSGAVVSTCRLTGALVVAGGSSLAGTLAQGGAGPPPAQCRHASLRLSLRR